jgi:hypothetical protein
MRNVHSKYRESFYSITSGQIKIRQVTYDDHLLSIGFSRYIVAAMLLKQGRVEKSSKQQLEPTTSAYCFRMSSRCGRHFEAFTFLTIFSINLLTMRRVLFFAAIALGVFSCADGGNNSTGSDSSNMSNTGSAGAMGTDSTGYYPQGPTTNSGDGAVGTDSGVGRGAGAGTDTLRNGRSTGNGTGGSGTGTNNGSNNNNINKPVGSGTRQ